MAIFISGVGKGIGYELLKKCIDQDIFVYGITRSKSDLKKFLKFGNKCKVFSGDINNLNNFKKILKLSINENKPIIGLVNNAGIRQRKKFEDFKYKDLLLIFKTNFFSIFLIIQLFIKYIKINKLNKLGVSVVNIGSIVGKKGFLELSGYGSTKSALAGLTRSLAVEFASSNIRFNTVSPGFIKSSYYENFKKKKSLYKWTLSKTLRNKWGNNFDVAELVIFLLSKKSNYINGQEIFIDDGWTIS